VFNAVIFNIYLFVSGGITMIAFVSFRSFHGDSLRSRTALRKAPCQAGVVKGGLQRYESVQRKVNHVKNGHTAVTSAVRSCHSMGRVIQEKKRLEMGAVPRAKALRHATHNFAC
jgi:hypothetical protein